MSAVRKNSSTGIGHAVLADRVFDGHGWHAEAAVLIRDGRIAGVEHWSKVPSDWPQTRLPAGAFLAPGFIDLQVNGGGGVLLNDQPTADGMRAIARAHRRFGTTACLPTLISDTREQMRAAIAAARSAAGRDGVLGPASGRPVHQSAAAGRASAGPYCSSLRGRPGGLARTRPRRHVLGHARAGMRSGGLCPDARFLRRAGFDRA